VVLHTHPIVVLHRTQRIVVLHRVCICG